jgi:hypothetical protein
MYPEHWRHRAETIAMTNFLNDTIHYKYMFSRCGCASIWSRRGWQFGRSVHQFRSTRGHFRRRAPSGPEPDASGTTGRVLVCDGPAFTLNI